MPPQGCNYGEFGIGECVESVDPDLADATQAFGCDPGMVPSGRMQSAVRLCEDCAARTGAILVSLGDEGSAKVPASLGSVRIGRRTTLKTGCRSARWWKTRNENARLRAS